MLRINSETRKSGLDTAMPHCIRTLRGPWTMCRVNCKPSTAACRSLLMPSHPDGRWAPAAAETYANQVYRTNCRCFHSKFVLQYPGPSAGLRVACGCGSVAIPLYSGHVTGLPPALRRALPRCRPGTQVIPFTVPALLLSEKIRPCCLDTCNTRCTCPSCI